MVSCRKSGQISAGKLWIGDSVLRPHCSAVTDTGHQGTSDLSLALCPTPERQHCLLMCVDLVHVRAAIHGGASTLPQLQRRINEVKWTNWL